MTVTCIYHAGCPDGFTAAWIVARAHKPGRVRLVEGRYGDPPPPDLAGDVDVYIVDFSYPADQLLDLTDRVATVTVLDHHQSAEQALTGLTAPSMEIVFDMDRSGAGITWDYFHRAQPRPLLVDHVEDRDLWRFALDGTHDVFAAVSSYPTTLEDWDRIAAMPAAELRAEGRAIQRFRAKLIDLAVEGAVVERIAGFDVPVANAPYAVGSDVAGELAKGQPFAAYWYEAAGERRWGLRSSPDGLDVAMIAERFGGGGHRHASGFTTRPGHIPEQAP